MHQSSWTAQRNWGARLRDITYLGMRTIVLENEFLRLGVLAGKGTDIIELNYKPHDLDFVWLSPGGVRNPTTLLPTSNDPVAPFVESYPGGWQEVFPSGGAPSEYGGAHFGQHGEVYAFQWDVDVLEDTEQSVAVQFQVRSDKMPFRLKKTVRLNSGQKSFAFEETMINEGAARLAVMWGQHITFGRPFLRPGCHIRLPDGLRAIPHPEDIVPGRRRLANADPFPWPHAPSGEDGSLDLRVIPEPGTPSDLVYITGFPESRAWYEVVDESRGLGARIEWDRDTMPYLWYWQEFGAHAAYPWYGRIYTIGLEPFSSFPTNGLAEAVENGTALEVDAGEEVSFNLEMSIIDTLDTTTRPLESEANA
jgi:hypothetical protein